jgi:hypothetical protein
MTAYNGKPACRLAATPEDFEHLNLTGASIALWEDGLRTDTKPGSYEWWYFDSHLDDGSSLVVAFYTKNPMEPGHPLEPFVTVALDRPGAKAVTIEQHFPAGQFTASKDRCDVRVAANAFSEDEHLDEHSGKPVGDVVGYEYDDGHDRYLVSFHRKRTIVNRQLIGEVSGYKHLLARLARFDGSYLRFTGTVQLEHFTDSQKIEDFSDPGIWELMYFGHTR